MQFLTASLFFLNMATLTKHRVLRYESYFPIFCVFVFFPEKHRKKYLKFQRAILDPKIPPKWSPGIRFGSQNGPDFTSERQQIRKLVRKCSFWAAPFFKHFLLVIFGIFKLSDVNSGPFWDPKRIPGHHFGWIFGSKIAL